MTGPGVTVIVASDPAVTMTVAVPEMVPLVAVTVFVNVPITAPAVNMPVELMAPPLAVTDQTGVIATTLPLASFPTATNWWVVLTASEPLGVTTMLASGLASGLAGAVESLPHAAMSMPVRAAAIASRAVSPDGDSARSTRLPLNTFMAQLLQDLVGTIRHAIDVPKPRSKFRSGAAAANADADTDVSPETFREISLNGVNDGSSPD